jgi:hypothetical protein
VFYSCPHIIVLFSRSIRFLQLSQFHSNNISHFQQTIQKYYCFFGLLAQLQWNQPLGTTPSNTSLQLKPQKCVSLQQVQFFFKECISPCINEVLSSLYQLIFLSETTDPLSMTAFLENYLQLICFSLSFIYRFPFATRFKEWEIIFFPYFFLLSLPENIRHSQEKMIEEIQQKTLFQILVALNNNSKVQRLQLLDLLRNILQFFPSSINPNRKETDTILESIIERQFNMIDLQKNYSELLTGTNNSDLEKLYNFFAVEENESSNLFKEFRDYLFSPQSFQGVYSSFHSFIQGIISTFQKQSNSTNRSKSSIPVLPVWLQEKALVSTIDTWKLQMREMVLNLN